MASSAAPASAEPRKTFEPPPGAALQMQKVQELVGADPKGGWDKAWQQAATPWDVGHVTPAVVHLLETGALPAHAASVFVPGCGTGYDVLALSNGGKRRVVGLDISETALARAREHAAGNPEESAVTFLSADFFTYTPEQPFDVIFDYTFFCAINPSLREDWGKKTAANLAQDGTLFTLAFPIAEHEGGPPYPVPLTTYEEVLTPHGLHWEELPTVSLPMREGKEKMFKWTRSQPAKV